MGLNTVTDAVPAARFTSAPDKLNIVTRISVALMAVAWIRQPAGMELEKAPELATPRKEPLPGTGVIVTLADDPVVMSPGVQAAVAEAIANVPAPEPEAML